MNRFFTLLLAASCLTAVGQEECTDISSTFNFSALYLEADYYAADSIHYFYVRFYPNGMGEYWQLNSYSIFGILSFEYSLCEQNGEIFYTDSWLYEAQVNPSGVFEGTTNLGYPFTYTPVRGGSPFETETNSCGWQPDGNGDNLIGVNDLLDLLGVYGDTDYDQDGIWDSADDCVGEYDECGVCNGSGPSIPIIESIEILYDSVYAEPIDEWLVFEVGADTTFSYTCFEWQCGDPLEYQGYDYETVQIGERCWFQEHLKSSSYLNGEEIPPFNGEHGGEGFVNLEGSWFYQWASAINPGGLCPQGWSVPNVMEYSTLLQDNGYEPMLYPDHPYASLLVGYVDSDVLIESPWIGLAGTNEYSWTSDMAGIAFKQTSSTAVLEGTLTGNAFTIRCIKDTE